MPYDPRFRSGVVNVFVLLLGVMLLYDLWGLHTGDAGYVGGVPVTLLLLAVVFAVSDGNVLYGDTDRTAEYVVGITLLGLGLGITSFEYAPRPTGTVLVILGVAVHPTTRAEILAELRNWELRFREARRSVV